MIKPSPKFNKLTILIGFSVMALSYSIFPSGNNSFTSNSTIEFNNPSYESFLLKNNENIFFQSKQAELNIENQQIKLNGKVEGKFNLDGETFNIKTESIRGNLLDKSILSKEEVLFETKDLEIVSSAMEIIQKPLGDIKILFWNASFNKVNTNLKILKGKANKIEFFPTKDLIFMEGNAEFYEDNMKIISDEIHYDLTENRILKSINAKIINQL